MLSNIILRSTAAFGGAPFRLKKCTALGSAGAGAGAGAAAGGVPGALVGGALGVASSLLGGLFGKSNTNKINEMNYKIMQEQNRFFGYQCVDFVSCTLCRVAEATRGGSREEDVFHRPFPRRIQLSV